MTVEPSGSVHVRPFRSGDEQGILKLFEAVFGEAKEEKEWRWKFAENPYTPPLASVAVTEQGEMVAHCTILPVNLNVMGRPVLAGQAVDTMVAEQFRGNQLFERTATECYQHFETKGGTLVYSTPNANSYPGLMRKLGRRRIGYFVEHTFRTGIRDIAERALRVPWAARAVSAIYGLYRSACLALREPVLRFKLSGPVSVTRERTVPEGYDRLWKAVSQLAVFSLWKDAEYCRWRYDRSTKTRAQYFCVRRGDELAAVAVVADQGKSLVISDLIVRDQNVRIARFLIHCVIKDALRSGKQTVKFSGLDAGFFDSAFEGFTRELDFGLILTARAFNLPGLADMVPLKDNWTVTLGDTDVL